MKINKGPKIEPCGTPQVRKKIPYALMALEGDSVTLSCNYSVSILSLYWYQQKSSSSPQLLIAEYSEKTEKLSFIHDKQSKELHLKISSAAVSDSAVYYCALQPTVTGNSKTLYKNTLTSCFFSTVELDLLAPLEGHISRGAT
uniref:Ig-like domain-containing protein n=1 Tax=Amphiprion percula TaxID=161767 RepID=A0A3P8SMP9_AMPPE